MGKAKARPGAVDDSIGDALRSAYDRAIDEAIPAEMLDLLKKLA